MLTGGHIIYSVKALEYTEDQSSNTITTVPGIKSAIHVALDCIGSKTLERN